MMLRLSVESHLVLSVSKLVRSTQMASWKAAVMMLRLSVESHLVLSVSKLVLAVSNPAQHCDGDMGKTVHAAPVFASSFSRFAFSSTDWQQCEVLAAAWVALLGTHQSVSSLHPWLGSTPS